MPILRLFSCRMMITFALRFSCGLVSARRFLIVGSSFTYDQSQGKVLHQGRCLRHETKHRSQQQQRFHLNGDENSTNQQHSDRLLLFLNTVRIMLKRVLVFLPFRHLHLHLQGHFFHAFIDALHVHLAHCFF